MLVTKLCCFVPWRNVSGESKELIVFCVILIGPSTCCLSDCSVDEICAGDAKLRERIYGIVDEV
jgi:hypothetical protein